MPPLNIRNCIKINRFHPFNTKTLRLQNCRAKELTCMNAQGHDKKEMRDSGELEKTRYGDWEKRGRCIDF